MAIAFSLLANDKAIFIEPVFLRLKLSADYFVDYIERITNKWSLVLLNNQYDTEMIFTAW